jgi:DNA-3-methyladenine glycosylase I
MKKRCPWAESDSLLIPYHDDEWGVPVYDDRLLFEMLNLEGAQAGLSWLTVLKKRDTYREVFDNFDAVKVAQYGDTKRAQLLADAGIIRNRLKVNATIENAKAFLEIQQEFGSFSSYIWSFVDGAALHHQDAARGLEISESMSKDLLKRGCKFVGPTICYAYMQAVGLINDHDDSCYRAKEIQNV